MQFSTKIRIRNSAMTFLDAAAELAGDALESVATEAQSTGRITHAFVSEAIAFIDYEIDTQELSVTFNRGGPYVYTGVPQSVVEGWLNAESAGGYYHRFIKAYA
jgi:guanyl-specific ribonuclease Sa